MDRTPDKGQPYLLVRERVVVARVIPADSRNSFPAAAAAIVRHSDGRQSRCYVGDLELEPPPLVRRKKPRGTAARSKRQPTHIIAVACSDQELQMLKNQAKAFGLTLGAYATKVLLDSIAAARA